MRTYKDLMTHYEVNGKVVCARETAGNEYAWQIREVLDVIEVLRKEGRVILGGDVLDRDMNYTYDNWYHNPSDPQTDCETSCGKAKAYVQRYLERFGPEYYVVLVVKPI